MSDAEKDQEQKRLETLIEVGGDTAGAATGAAISLVLTPVGGAGVGVVVASLLKRVGLEIHDRFTEPRRQLRVGAAYAVAAEEVAERLESGEKPRDDGFFDGDGDSPAEEILEGTLEAAADSFEQRKVPYLGKFYAALVFAPDVSPALANRLVLIAEQLTFRQLACMAVIETGSQLSAAESLLAEKPDHELGFFGEELGVEMDALAALGLLGVADEDDGEILPPAIPSYPGSSRAPTYKEIQAIRAGLTTIGRRLYELMGLGSITDQERKDAFAAVGLMPRER